MNDYDGVGSALAGFGRPNEKGSHRLAYFKEDIAAGLRVNAIRSTPLSPTGLNITHRLEVETK